MCSNTFAKIPRRLFCLALAVVLLLAPGSLLAAESFTLPGLGGGQLTDADLEKGTSIIVIWASWSPRCREIASQANTLADTWSASSRVVTVVFQEDAETVRSFLAGKGLRPPVYLDSNGSFSKKHAVTTLPGLLVVRDGEVVYRGKLTADPDPVIRRSLG